MIEAGRGASTAVERARARAPAGKSRKNFAKFLMTAVALGNIAGSVSVDDSGLSFLFGSPTTKITYVGGVVY